MLRICRLNLQQGCMAHSNKIALTRHRREKHKTKLKAYGNVVT
jgi:hypothetical protein